MPPLWHRLSQMLSRELLAGGRTTVGLYATAVVCVQCAVDESVPALMCFVLAHIILPGIHIRRAFNYILYWLAVNNLKLGLLKVAMSNRS